MTVLILRPHSVAKSKKTISKVKKPKELNTKASSNVSKGFDNFSKHF